MEWQKPFYFCLWRVLKMQSVNVEAIKYLKPQTAVTSVDSYCGWLVCIYPSALVVDVQKTSLFSSLNLGRAGPLLLKHFFILLFFLNPLHVLNANQ